MRLKWARIYGKWQVVIVEGSFFSVCGNGDDCKIKSAKYYWGEDFKWGSFLVKPKKYKNAKNKRY